jgi:hypothetical protein
VLYRVRPGDRNESLRYSLRSLRHLEHGEVFVVGYVPEWVQGVHHIVGSSHRHKWRIVLEHLWLACRELGGRRLILMDDDMYLLEPVSEVPALHRGTLLGQALAHPGGTYGHSLRASHDYLVAQGVASPLSYELHVPMPIDATVAAAVLEPVIMRSRPVQGRSVYANLAHLESTPAEDVKVRGSSDVRALPAGPLPGPWISTAPAGWEGMGSRVRGLFPDASPYER